MRNIFVHSSMPLCMYWLEVPMCQCRWIDGRHYLGGFIDLGVSIDNNQPRWTWIDRSFPQSTEMMNDTPLKFFLRSWRFPHTDLICQVENVLIMSWSAINTNRHDHHHQAINQPCSIMLLTCRLMMNEWTQTQSSHVMFIQWQVKDKIHTIRHHNFDFHYLKFILEFSQIKYSPNK